MPHFLVLGKFTEKGINSVEEHPERVKRFKEICQGEGAKVVSMHLLMGKYDIACMVEAPSLDVMTKLSLIVGKRGNVRTHTMCAFTEKETSDIIQKIASH